MAAGRADCGARCRRTDDVRKAHDRSSCARRDDHCGNAWTARDRGARVQDRRRVMTALAAIIRRDLRIALRVGGGALIGVLFFLSVIVLMPFALGPDLPLLARLGPAILWLGALLASLLTLDRLFTADHEDGSLDLIAMSRTPLELTCAAKALAHWLPPRRSPDHRDSRARPPAQPRHDGNGGCGADPARGHAGADLHRHDRRRASG